MGACLAVVSCLCFELEVGTDGCGNGGRFFFGALPSLGVARIFHTPPLPLLLLLVVATVAVVPVNAHASYEKNYTNFM